VADLYRPRALASASSALDERPRVQLLPPRRWLIAVALIVVLIAGVIFVAVTSVVAPVRGVGYRDQGGFSRVSSSVSGVTLPDFKRPGEAVAEGEELVRIVNSQGTEISITSPADGVVMQMLIPGAGWSVTPDQEIYIVAGIDPTAEPSIIMLLPGEQAGDFTPGNLTVGSTAWLEPVGRPAIACQLDQVDPYALSAEQVEAFIPDVMVKQYVQKMGTVQYAGATCPMGAIDDLLPGMPVPVSVAVRQDALLSFIFGRG